MKKLFKIAITLLLLLALLCGCVPKDASPDNTTDTNTDGNDSSTAVDDTSFEDFGMQVIEICLSEVDINEDGTYISLEEVAAYIFLFHALPQNYVTKSEYSSAASSEKSKLSVGGNVFYNREGLLPKADGRTYTECDIDATGNSRGAKRVVFSSDWLIFYTSDHYESFSIVKIVDDRT